MCLHNVVKLNLRWYKRHDLSVMMKINAFVRTGNTKQQVIILTSAKYFPYVDPLIIDK